MQKYPLLVLSIGGSSNNHAYQTELPEPQPDKPACFVDGLDKEFTATIKMLTKHNSKGLDAFLNLGNFTNIIETQRLY